MFQQCYYDVALRRGHPSRNPSQIYNTTARYALREKLLIATIMGFGVDVLGLQEVVFGDGGQTETLKAAGGWTHSFEAPLDAPILPVGDPSFRIDGNAILAMDGEWQVVEGSHETLRLSVERSAQRLRLRHRQGGAEVVVANTHLHWASNPLGVSQRSDAEIRGDQMEAVVRWLQVRALFCCLPQQSQLRCFLSRVVRLFDMIGQGLGGVSLRCVLPRPHAGAGVLATPNRAARRPQRLL